MGYTHSWRMSKDFTDSEWEIIRNGATEIINKCVKDGLVFADYFGEVEMYPTITDQEIGFNGYDEDSHETFILTKDATIPEWASREGHFAFCKTARKPYDLAVISILSWAKTVAPESIALTSDGDDDVFDNVVKPNSPLERLTERLSNG